jgi:hypothetical protein
MCERAVMQVHKLVDMCERISSTFKFVNLKIGKKLACANRPLVTFESEFALVNNGCNRV